MKMIACLLFGVALVGTPVGAKPMKPQSLATVRAHIDRQNANYVKAVVRGDVKTYTQLFTRDALLLRGSRIIEAQKHFVQTGIVAPGPKPKDLPKNLSVYTKKVEVSGDMAYEIGSYALTSADGKTNKGNSLTVWKQQPDGSWKIHVEASVPNP